MKQHLPEEFSTRLIRWGPFVIMGNTVPPKDPVEDEEEEDNADEPPVVREPDEDYMTQPVRRIAGSTARAHRAAQRGRGLDPGPYFLFRRQHAPACFPKSARDDAPRCGSAPCQISP